MRKQLFCSCANFYTGVFFVNSAVTFV